MEMPQHVIYLPGLGDHHSRLQEAAVGLWRVYGVIPHFHRIGWADNESFEGKLVSILNEVDKYAEDGEVSLVGTSAGASAALNAFARRQGSVKRVVTICGKIQNLETIDEKRFKRNPAFRGSVELLPESLKQLNQEDLSNILNIYPLWDGIVPIKDAIIEGAHSLRMLVPGHVFSIGYTISFGAHSIAKFIKAD